MKKNSLFLLSLGLLSALFFSATFLINKVISIDGGHWFYSASLRFVYTLIFISILLIFYKGLPYYKRVLKEYISHFRFWTISGTIGFGVFYSMICFAADYSPAWVLATTWQFTIFASLFVLLLFGKKLTKITIICTIIVVVGITLVNISHFDFTNMDKIFYAVLPVLIAAFAFPFGNQLVWEEKKKRDIDLLHNGFVKVFLLTLGSFPLWICLFFVLDVGVPSSSQLINVAFITILSGVIASSLFLYARSKADTSSKIMIVDSTIASEVIFTLTIEVMFLGAFFPNLLGIFAIVVTFLALAIMVYFDKETIV